MQLRYGYGSGEQQLYISAKHPLRELRANEIAAPTDEAGEVLRALNAPIGTRLLREIVKPGEKIAIITSDITRPMPTHIVMEPLLAELAAAGVEMADVALIFALGSHRFHTEAEMKKLAGDFAWGQIRCMDGDPSNCVHMGTTSRGTPVDIVRIVAEADRRICLGNIEYHYFAGYSGGAKAIMPGVSTREAIQNNHSRMIEVAACAGKISGNPVREDIEEAAALVGVDFIVNVVLDEHKKIVKAFAGDVTLAHREGCAFLDSMYQAKIAERADIVVASQGGAPKDLNLYQTQKALDNAKHAVRKGGIIVLVGACGEGFGEHVFEQWMTSAPTPASMIERIAVDFQLGGHKAAAIAMVLEDAQIFMVSQMDGEMVRRMGMVPFSDVQAAFDAAEKEMGEDASVISMPFGGSTLPVVMG